MLLQSIEDCLLQHPAADPQSILTGALVARGVAAEMRLADLDVAGAALDEARKQVARPAPVPRLCFGALGPSITSA